jgi:glutathione S-transferase
VDFYSINPKGNVPALILDDGTVLNENAATLQYIADLAPGTVGAAAGTKERYELIGALSYISSEVHGTMGGLFYPASEDAHDYIRGKLAEKLDYVEAHFIGEKQFVVGHSFTVADAYLYIVLSWMGYAKVDLTAYPRTKAYSERIGQLEIVKKAHALNPSLTAAFAQK